MATTTTGKCKQSSLVALAIVMTGCSLGAPRTVGDRASEPGGVPTSAPPTAPKAPHITSKPSKASIPASRLTPAAGQRIVEGASTTVRTSGTSDKLWVFVERVRTTEGTQTTIEVERTGRCSVHAGVGTCKVLWKERKRIPDSAFSMDAQLGWARLAAVAMRGERLTASWTSAQSTPPKPRTEGKRTLYRVDARVVVSYLGSQWRGEAESVSGIFRRFEPVPS